MFKVRSSKNGKHSVIHQLEQSSGVIADKASESIKAAEEQLDNLKKFIFKQKKKNEFDHFTKEAGMTLAAILGAGLIVYGVYRILSK